MSSLSSSTVHKIGNDSTHPTSRFRNALALVSQTNMTIALEDTAEGEALLKWLTQ